MTQKYKLTKKGRDCGEVTLCQACRLLLKGSEVILDAVKNRKEIDGYLLEKAQPEKNIDLKRAVLEKYGWEELRRKLNPNAKG